MNDPDDPRSCVCFLLSRAAQTAQKHLRHLLEPYGITPAQYLIIECLWRADGLSPKLLGELLRFDSATLTGLIDRLERSGFVFRERNLEDRRAIQIRLTKKGTGHKKKLRALRLQANEKILKEFPQNKRVLFKNALAELISAGETIP
ncbi:MAG: MarR family transcriptional regulator [Proteobacteria bacterium]|nr:MarR family transcriptional regulator [Pseudomonadota bacterium]